MAIRYLTAEPQGFCTAYNLLLMPAMVHEPIIVGYTIYDEPFTRSFEVFKDVSQKFSPESLVLLIRNHVLYRFLEMQ